MPKRTLRCELLVKAEAEASADEQQRGFDEADGSASAGIHEAGQSEGLHGPYLSADFSRKKRRPCRAYRKPGERTRRLLRTR